MGHGSLISPVPDLDQVAEIFCCHAMGGQPLMWEDVMAEEGARKLGVGPPFM